jgi:germination protein M
MRSPFVIATIALLAAGCGQGSAQVVSSVSPGGGPVSSGPAATQPPPDSGGGSSTPPPAPAETTTVQTWFIRGETLWYATRQVERKPGIGAETVRALLAGPSSTMRAAGVGTVIPSATQLLGLDVSGGIATVDMSSEFASGGGSLSEQMRLAQLVYTLTQFPTVKGVRLKLDGQDTKVFSGEGIVLPDPMRRSSFADLLPPIVVESPGIADMVAGPFVVKGTANVFEANVSIEVRTASGKVLLRTFTTATCGTGCRGRYAKTITLMVTKRTPATLVVHDDDAAGMGTPPHQVVIPLLLVPAGS